MKYHPLSYNTHKLKGPPHPTTPNPQEVPPTILQHSYTKRTPNLPPLSPTHRKYHPSSYNTHTLKGPPTPYPQSTGSTTHHLTTLIHPQCYNTHTLKGSPTPLLPTHRKYHPPSYNTHTPTILQHAYTKGTPYPTPQPTGSTTHHVTTLIHPQSYNTHTLKGPPHPPTHNPQEVPPTMLQHSYTKGTPHPLPPTHRKYHPPSYNTHILKGPPAPHPPTPNPQEVPPTILQHSYTKWTPTPLPPTHRKYHPPSYYTHTPTILH